MTPAVTPAVTPLVTPAVTPYKVKKIDALTSRLEANHNNHTPSASYVQFQYCTSAVLVSRRIAGNHKESPCASRRPMGTIAPFKRWCTSYTLCSHSLHQRRRGCRKAAIAGHKMAGGGHVRKVVDRREMRRSTWCSSSAVLFAERMPLAKRQWRSVYFAPDHDFAYMASARHFVPGGGGFVMAAATLVKRAGGHVYTCGS